MKTYKAGQTPGPVPESRSEVTRCCGEADVVRTKFKVESKDSPHPEGTWYAWINEGWVENPSVKVVNDTSPTGEALVFMLAGTPVFVPPKGGL